MNIFIQFITHMIIKAWKSTFGSVFIKHSLIKNKYM